MVWHEIELDFGIFWHIFIRSCSSTFGLVDPNAFFTIKFQIFQSSFRSCAVEQDKHDQEYQTNGHPVTAIDQKLQKQIGLEMFTEAQITNLSPWVQGQSCVVGNDHGEDGLKKQGHEGIQAKHEPVAVFSDIACDFITRHRDQKVVEYLVSPISDVGHDGVARRGHGDQNQAVHERNHEQNRFSDQPPIKVQITERKSQ